MDGPDGGRGQQRVPLADQRLQHASHLHQLEQTPARCEHTPTPNILLVFLLQFFTTCSFSSLSLVSTGGCVAMSGGPALGQWEVKNCSSFKALSLCKQDISGYQEVNVTDYHPYPDTPCAPGWQSRAGLFSCYKVGSSSDTLFSRHCGFWGGCKSNIVFLSFAALNTYIHYRDTYSSN